MDNIKKIFFLLFDLNHFSFPVLVMSLISGLLFKFELYEYFITFVIYISLNFINMFIDNSASYIVFNLNQEERRKNKNG